MKLAFTHLRLPAITSSALLLPFIILELVNRRSYHEGFPIPLFGILWLLPMAFTLILMSIVRKVQTGNKTTPNTISLLLGIALLILMVWLWVGIILDQMPCFLGVPLCD
jgi:hypothetical protein